MSLITQYCQKNPKELEEELLKLISKYNKTRKTNLFVFFTASNKGIQSASLEHDDYFVICDLLRNLNQKKIDVMLETPGGSGEAAEDIVKFLRSHFEEVNFIICGKAMSAGTILALSADEIFMTETGSLGPIDAQMRIGRSVLSAYDYISWVDDKRKEAAVNGKLNPVDATIAAQITPGELNSVLHAQAYAVDMVKEWLPKYKFKNWTETETNKTPVTDAMRQEQAQKIAEALTNHSSWRTHGRPLKIADLEKIGLQIKAIDEDPSFADIIYRIDTICRLLTGNTPIYKIFANEKFKILKQAAINQSIHIPMPQQVPGPLDYVEIQAKCQGCGKLHALYAKIKNDPGIDNLQQSKGRRPLPSNCKLSCECGFENDLTNLKDDIEKQTKCKLSL